MLDCLVIGGRSPIGRALVSTLRQAGMRVEWTSRHHADEESLYLELETLAGLSELPDAKYVALVAAETKFDICASQPDRTQRINVAAPVAIAQRYFARRHAKILFLSSIAVHDGMIDMPREDANPAPNSVYGTQKLDAENRLAALGGQLVILRPSKVVTPDFALFSSWKDSLLNGRAITPFADMFVSPVSLDLVASVAAKLMCDDDANGIFHLSAIDQLSYADIANIIAGALGTDQDLVVPALARSGPTPKWLPDYARLDCTRLANALGTKIPASREAIEYFLAAGSRQGR